MIGVDNTPAMVEDSIATWFSGRSPAMLTTVNRPRDAFGNAHHLMVCVAQDYSGAAFEQQRPSVLYRPRIAIDGNMWCAVYGDNIQEGVAGFGESPALAMADFNKNWNVTLRPTPELSRRPKDGRLEWIVRTQHTEHEMKVTLQVELQPFQVPNFVRPVVKPGKRDDGFAETAAYPLSDLDSLTLDRLCDQFRDEVFRKAGKEQPPRAG